jgi:hypothetical protein
MTNLPAEIAYKQRCNANRYSGVETLLAGMVWRRKIRECQSVSFYAFKLRSFCRKCSEKEVMFLRTSVSKKCFGTVA